MAYNVGAMSSSGLKTINFQNMTYDEWKLGNPYDEDELTDEESEDILCDIADNKLKQLKEDEKRN